MVEKMIKQKKNQNRKWQSLILITFFLTANLVFAGCGANTPPNAATTDTTANTNEQTTTDAAANVGEQASTDAAATTDGQAPTDAATTTDEQAPTDAAANVDGQTTADAAATDNKLTTLAKPIGAIPEPTVSLPEVHAGETNSIVGIITDATSNSVSIQTPDGNFYSLTIPKSGVEGNLSRILVGQIATFGYQGSLDENHASLVNISNSTMETGIYIEEYAFAIKIINAVRSMDLEALSDLTNFPVFLQTGSFSSHIDTPGEFEAINSEKIFSPEFVDRLLNYNLFDLQYTSAGFVMGDGSPNITFDVDDNGILGVIGMNCTKLEGKPSK